MNIAFDIDGVLTDIEEFQLFYGEPFFKKHFGKDVVNENGYGIKEIFNCSAYEESLFWIKYAYKYFYSIEARTYASEVLKELKTEGDNIAIITSRALTTGQPLLSSLMRKIVYLWLEKNKIYYDFLEFCSTANSPIAKARVSKKNGIDIFVDDYIKNIEVLSKMMLTICFNTKNNSSYDNNNIYRANDFVAVYNIIEFIKTKELVFKNNTCN